jgi:protein KRI1
MATDKELNEYMSVKKYAPYRLAKADKHRYGKAQQEKLQDLKSKVAERSGGAFGFDATGQAERDLNPKKRKGKKERMRVKSDVAA